MKSEDPRSPQGLTSNRACERHARLSDGLVSLPGAPRLAALAAALAERSRASAGYCPSLIVGGGPPLRPAPSGALPVRFLRTSWSQPPLAPGMMEHLTRE